MIDMAPKIFKNSLLSTGKFSDAKYGSIFNKDKVNIYDINNTVIKVSKQEIVNGWIDPASGLWRFLIVPKEKI